MKKENPPNQLFTTWQGRSVDNYSVGVSQNVKRGAVDALSVLKKTSLDSVGEPTLSS
jgi:hypothetical protein